ncbi:hypothetical protein [Natronospira bacteriovora]|uniref:Outer membrane protein beta-barrel domain-containing protein n=1 Tax=Natronospira bacteriovora TaxID=3069753 RepID=A0ABU0W936_9GAMM|nr:hypothetical protein [Natronospira sp. AB-CW4]MDQ2070273.1 hypothetical protein [Natronospira sp. AB-CW4]
MRLTSQSVPLIFIACLLLAVPRAEAANDSGPDQRDFWSLNFGIAYAWDEHAFRDFNGNDVATWLSGGWGGHFGFMPDWMGMEAELATTVTDGSWLGEDWSMISGAFYLSTYTGSERLYLKLRGGLSSNRVKIGNYTGSDTGLAGGAGIGFQFLGQPLELHFTAVDGDVNTLTLHWRF